MSIPKELLPRTTKKEKLPKEPRPEGVGAEKTKSENFKVAEISKVKKPFPWRFLATRILPIFLFIILAAGISIAAVPSWRAAFNNFIAKWSPRAEEIAPISITETKKGYFVWRDDIEHNQIFSRYEAKFEDVLAKWNLPANTHWFYWKNIKIDPGFKATAKWIGDNVDYENMHIELDTEYINKNNINPKDLTGTHQAIFEFEYTIINGEGDYTDIKGETSFDFEFTGHEVSYKISEDNHQQFVPTVKYGEYISGYDFVDDQRSEIFVKPDGQDVLKTEFILKDHQGHPIVNNKMGLYIWATDIKSEPPDISYSLDNSTFINAVMEKTQYEYFSIINDLTTDQEGKIVIYLKSRNQNTCVYLLIHSQTEEPGAFFLKKRSLNASIEGTEAVIRFVNPVEIMEVNNKPIQIKNENGLDVINQSIQLNEKGNYLLNPDDIVKVRVPIWGSYDIIKGINLPGLKGYAYITQDINNWPKEPNIGKDKVFRDFDVADKRELFFYIKGSVDGKSVSDLGESKINLEIEYTNIFWRPETYKETYHLESDKVLNFGTAAGDINSCTHASDEQKAEMKKVEEELKSESTAPPSPQSNNISKLKNLAVNIKNKLVSVLNNFKEKISHKVYSQEPAPELECIVGEEIYPGNKKTIQVVIQPDKDKNIIVEIPEYFDIEKTSEDVKTVDKDGKHVVTWEVKKSEDKEKILNISTSLTSDLKKLLSNEYFPTDGEVKILFSTQDINGDNLGSIQKVKDLEFHINILPNYPELKINKIKRKITVKVKQPDGSYKEEEQDKEITIPTDIDYTKEPSADIKPYFYYDEEAKQWKEKIFPGDEITFFILYNHQFIKDSELNDKLPPLKNVDMYFYLPEYTELIDQSSEVTGNAFPDTPNLYKINKESIAKSDKATEVFKGVAKVPEEVMWDKYFDFRLFAGIGKLDNKVFVTEKTSENKIKFAERGLWGTLGGKVTGPYEPIKNGEGYVVSNENNKPVPALGMGIYDIDNKLMVGMDTEDHQKFKGQKLATDEEGNYQVDFNREWLINLYSQLKIKLIFDSQNIAGDDNPDIEDFPINYKFSDGKQAYISLLISPQKFTGKKLEKYDIPLRDNAFQTDLNWEYPKGKFADEAKLDADTYANFYYARKITKDLDIYNTTGKQIDVRLSSIIGGEAQFDVISGNNIMFSKDDYKLATTRYPRAELHEFTHYLQAETGIMFKVAPQGYDQVCPYGSTCIYSNHYGWANSSSYDSFLESFAEVGAKYFEIKIKSMLSGEMNNDGLMHATNGGLPINDTNQIGMVEGSALNGLGKTTESISCNDVRENEEQMSVNMLAVLLNLGKIRTKNSSSDGYIPQDNIPWIDSGKEAKPAQIGPFTGAKSIKELDNNFKSLYSSVINNSVHNFQELYNSLNLEKEFLQEVSQDGYNMSKLQQIYALYGVFRQDIVYYLQYYTPQPFYWGNDKDRLGNSGVQFYINDNHLVTEKEMDTLSGTYDFTLCPSGTNKKVQIKKRLNRPAQIYPGSMIKLNFNDSNGNSNDGIRKVKLIIDSPAVEGGAQQDNHIEYEFMARDDEVVYMTDPYEIKPAEIYLTAEGSSEYVAIDNSDYWNAMESTDNYDYYMSKTFTIDGSVPPTVDEIIEKEKEEPTPEPTPTPTPTETPTPTITQTESPSPTPSETITPAPTQTEISSPAPTQTTAPAVTIVDDDGNQANNTSGGSTIHVEAEGFKGGESADVYVNNKKVSTVSLVNGGEDGFGLKVDMPDNAPIGKNEIKIVDDKGHVASSNINVKSNKWLNAKVLIIALSILFISIIGYFVYRYYHQKPKLGLPV